MSFEFFAPTEPGMEVLLWVSARRLEPFVPRFVSVAYGADGCTRGTLKVIRRLQCDGKAITAHDLAVYTSTRSMPPRLAAST